MNVNGQELYLFQHRLPVERVCALEIGGDVSIDSINIIGVKMNRVFYWLIDSFIHSFIVCLISIHLTGPKLLLWVFIPSTSFLGHARHGGKCINVSFCSCIWILYKWSLGFWQEIHSSFIHIVVGKRRDHEALLKPCTSSYFETHTYSTNTAFIISQRRSSVKEKASLT